MTHIDLIDNKGDYWHLIWANAPTRYLHKGHAYWKAWWYAPTRPHDFRNYNEVPLPIFTDWWDDWKVPPEWPATGFERQGIVNSVGGSNPLPSANIGQI